MKSEKPVALVTGASRGIGRAVALRLGRDGMHVAINYQSRLEDAEATLAAIVADGGSAELLPFDVADPSAVDSQISKLVETHGRCDALVNNAGISADALLLRLRDEDWQRVLATNLGGVMHCSRATCRTMVRARYGRIVSIGSVIGEMGNTGQSAYAAAKAGLEGFTKSLARELASRNITVNVVSPGFIDTEMVARLPEAVRKEYLQRIPAGRLGTAEEVADAVAFLIRPDSGYITGHVLSVNGGLYM